MDDLRASTGVVGLDDILAGGLATGRVHLVEGSPGTGKTTLALQFLFAGRDKGERSLYVTFSESADELRAAAASHGWTLDGITIHELLGDVALDPAAEQSVLRPSEIELGETVRAVMRLVEESRPARIVFDGLSELRLLAQDSLRYRRQVLALKQFFSIHEITTLLLDDQTLPQGNLQLHSIASAVIQLVQAARPFGNERRQLRVVKVRGGAFRAGWHDYVIDRTGIRVFPRLVAAEYASSGLAEPVTTGLPALDAMLGGGLVPGTNLLVAGPAGVGKTTIAARCLVALLDAGRSGAMFQFDEERATLLTRCRALGLDLQPWLDLGALTLRTVDPAQLSPGEFIADVRDLVERKGVRTVVFDSLDGFLQAMQDGNQLLLQLHELLSYLNRMGCLTLLVLGLRDLAGAAAAVDINYLADSVLTLRFFTADGAVRRAIRAVKTRMLPHEHTVRELLIGGSEGLALSEPVQEAGALLPDLPKSEGGA